MKKANFYGYFVKKTAFFHSLDRITGAVLLLFGRAGAHENHARSARAVGAVPTAPVISS